MTVNNYGSIFVKIDRNVLMLNEFFALYAYAFDIETFFGMLRSGRKIRNEFNVLKTRSKYVTARGEKSVEDGKDEKLVLA